MALNIFINAVLILFYFVSNLNYLNFNIFSIPYVTSVCLTNMCIYKNHSDLQFTELVKFYLESPVITFTLKLLLKFQCYGF